MKAIRVFSKLSKMRILKNIIVLKGEDSFGAMLMTSGMDIRNTIMTMIHQSRFHDGSRSKHGHLTIVLGIFYHS